MEEYYERVSSEEKTRYDKILIVPINSILYHPDFWSIENGERGQCEKTSRQ
jgi:hypothetical protein